MTAVQDEEALCRLIRLQADHVSKREDALAVLGALQFVDFLNQEPRLRGLLSEYWEESKRAWQVYREVNKRALKELSTIWKKHRVALKRIRAHSDRSHWETWGFDSFGSQIAEGLKKPIREFYTSNPPAPSATLATRLRAWIGCAHAGSDDTWTEPSLKLAHGKVEQLQDELKWAWLQLRPHLELHPWVAYQDLVKEARCLVPKPNPRNKSEKVQFELSSMLSDDRWTAINEDQLQPKSRKIGKRVIVQVEKLAIALQTSLLVRKSQHALMRRFAARCESFEAARLRDLANKPVDLPKKSRKPRINQLEAELTIEFARYLFDSGYNPILNPVISGLKPDVLDPTRKPGLYVELKQYNRATLSRIKGNVAQVLNTWSKVAKRVETPEAVLLIFRVGGDSLQVVDELPTPLGRLLIQVVDIAPAAISGSKTKRCLQVTAEQLLPAVTAVTERVSKPATRRRKTK